MAERQYRVVVLDEKRFIPEYKHGWRTLWGWRTLYDADAPAEYSHMDGALMLIRAVEARRQRSEGHGHLVRTVYIDTRRDPTAPEGVSAEPEPTLDPRGELYY